MTKLTWAESYVADQISAHCAMASGKAVVIAYTTKAAGKYERVLSGDLPDNVRATPLENVNSVCSTEASVVAVVGASLDDARTAYASLGSVKDLGVPVTFCLPERRIVQTPPSWQSAGMQYEGMFFLAGQYVRTLRPKGAYCEFGVFDGRTFVMASHALRGVCSHFYAFDSYRGIGGSNQSERTHFNDGDYRANTETLNYNMRFAGLSDAPYSVRSGFFEDTLSGRTSRDDEVGPVSIAHIDVDVYKPAKLALDYITDGLVDGALILFDDYDHMGARNDMGERRAVAEWLGENPRIALEPYRNYGVVCRSFIVHKTYL